MQKIKPTSLDSPECCNGLDKSSIVNGFPGELLTRLLMDDTGL